MEYKGQYWLTNAMMVRYQSMLCENPHMKPEVVNEVFSSHPDLSDQPLA
jgi:hypothetical protein